MSVPVCVHLWLKNQSLKAQNQVPINVAYKGAQFGDYYADIVVENRVIIELIAIEKLKRIHEAQILNYLKATKFEIGLLVNFTHPKAQVKRYVLSL